MAYYKFECDDEGTITTVEFDTENPCWSGYDGPVWKFFDFLKGCGFVFDKEDMMGIMVKEGVFKGADGNE